MFSTRPLQPLEFIFPIDESSQEHNSLSSQSSPSPTVFDIKFEDPFHVDETGDAGDIWSSLLEDKSIFSNPSNCLPDFDSDEGYIDYSSTYSSGVLSPDLEFLGLKSFKELENGNTHKDLQIANFQNFDFLPTKIYDQEPKMFKMEIDEFTFDDCLMSIPPSPETSSGLDALFSFQSSKSPSYSCDQYTSFDKKDEISSYADDFDVSCFEKNILDTSNQFESHKLSPDNSTQLNCGDVSNPELFNMIFSHELNSNDNSKPCSDNKYQDIFKSGAGDDHVYAAKLPAASSINKLKKRGPAARAHESSKISKLQNANSSTPSSVLEMFLLSNRALDPNKGSNAALASELKRYEKLTGSRPDKLLKKLLTADFDRRRNVAKH